MSQIRLSTLTLKNFKGIENLFLEANGENLSIYGANETGKTTIVDAWMWLLFGKDSLNQSDFEIKTINGSEPVHGLEHEVSAQLLPEELTLTKRLTEKWTKKRGNAEKVFTGHQVDHFVDGVPMQKKEFDRVVSAIADEQLFRLLTNPRHFNENLHWTKRREMLLAVCGDVTDEDVIAASAKLQDLPSILNGRSLDDHIKVLKAKKTEINRELDQIPVRISEVQQAKEPEGGKDAAWTLSELRTRRQKKQKELERVRSGGELAEKVRELREVEASILDAENKAKQKQQEKLNEKQTGLFYLKNGLADIERKLKDQESILTATHQAIGKDEARIVELRAEWGRIDAHPCTCEETCPTCGQRIPDGQIEESQKAFNSLKAKQLTEISTQGKLLKSSIEAARKEILKLEKELSSLKSDHEKTAQNILKLEQEITSIQNSKPKNSIDISDVFTKKQQLEKTIEELRVGAVDTGDLEAEIALLNQKIAAQETILAEVKLWAAGQERIKELKGQERSLANEFNQCEKEIALCDEFTRTKVAMLTDRINSKFILARFKLFSENINGGIEPCCEVMVNGVPYSSLNNAMRINVGIAICNTLSDHHGIILPMFCDNAEAVCDLLPSRGQQIRLVVSAQDKTLRIQKEV